VEIYKRTKKIYNRIKLKDKFCNLIRKWKKMRSDVEKWLREEGEKVFKDIGIKKGSIILDFGCGSGNYTIPAAKTVGKKGKIYALDKDRTDLSKLMQKAKLFGLENVEIIKTSGGLKIPLGN